MHGFVSSAEALGSGARTCTIGVTSRGGFSRDTSVDWSTEPGPRCEARRDADYQNDRDQYERPGPRLPVPLVVWADRVIEDLERERRDRLTQRCRPELIAERSEEKRRRLAGDSCHRNQRSGHDAGERGAENDGYRGPPPWIPERERGLSQGCRNDEKHLFGRAGDEGNHHRAQRHSARQRREVADGPDEKLPCENPDDDRGKSVQHVGEKTHRGRERCALFFREVESGADTYRQPDDACYPDEHQRTHDRVGHSAARLAHRPRHVREECERKGGCALPEQVSEN